MKKFLLGMFIVLSFAGISSAGDWGLYIGRVPGPQPCPPRPYCDPYGRCYPPPRHYFYYTPPRAYEFGFFHYRDRDRYHNHKHGEHRGR